MSDMGMNLVLVGKELRTDLTRDYVLEPDSTALIIIDMQYMTACRTTGMGRKFAEDGHGDLISWRYDRIEQKVVPNLQRLLSLFREHRLEIVYITVGARDPSLADLSPHLRNIFEAYHRVPAPGWSTNDALWDLPYLPAEETANSILKEIAPLKGETIVNKTTTCAFASTDLEAYLRGRGIKHLLFTGVSTSACVDSTARFAADRGFYGTIIDDACSDLIRQNHVWSVLNFRRCYGQVATTEEVAGSIAMALKSGSR